MNKYYEIVTKGKGQFPFDMLRYSHCWPITAADAENLATPETLDEYRVRRTVHVAFIGGSVEAIHCVERFKSFNWHAEVVKEEKL